jgi:predicted alpha/beta hydrolase
MMVDRRTMDRPTGRGLASALLARGLAVLNVDFRGHGESVLPTPASFSFDDIVRHDVPALVFALRDRFPSLPRFLVGHSLGVNAGLPGLARLPNHGVRAAVAIAPNLWAPKFEPSLLRRMKKRAMVAAFELAALPTGFVDPAPFGMGRSRIPRPYVAQFGKFYREDRLVSLDGADDYEQGLGSLELPILAWSGGGDTLMAHPDAVSEYLRLFTRARVLHRRYVGADGFEPDHMQLVIDERCQPLFEESADFLLQFTD